MSNQASELFELCKEVYERTGWEDVRDFYHENDTFDEETQTFKRNGIFSIVERKRADYNIPLYTSDYLLEKLKPFLNAERKSLSFRFADNVFWLDADDIYNGPRLSVIQADTTLKALLKLTIALSEAGELK